MQLIITSKRTIENLSSEVICKELDSIPRGHEFAWTLMDTKTNFVQARGSLDEGFCAEYRSVDGLFMSSSFDNDLEQIKKFFLLFLAKDSAYLSVFQWTSFNER